MIRNNDNKRHLEVVRALNDIQDMMKHKQKNETIDDEELVRSLGRLLASMNLDWNEYEYMQATMRYYQNKSQTIIEESMIR